MIQPEISIRPLVPLYTNDRSLLPRRRPDPAMAARYPDAALLPATSPMAVPRLRLGRRELRLLAPDGRDVAATSP